jgi:predicted HTH domain antitoxin
MEYVNGLTMVDWQVKQLVKSGIYADEQAVLRSALRALYQAHPEAKIKMVITSYESGEISLGKAANMLGVSPEEMKEILREAGYEIHFGPESLEELMGDVQNA